MPTLHIEHTISDFEVWQQAFERFDDARQQAGVRSHQVRRPVDDGQYVVIDLAFATVEQAERFRDFLHEKGVVIVRQLAGVGRVSLDEDPRAHAEQLARPMSAQCGGVTARAIARPAI